MRQLNCVCYDTEFAVLRVIKYVLKYFDLVLRLTRKIHQVKAGTELLMVTRAISTLSGLLYLAWLIRLAYLRSNSLTWASQRLDERNSIKRLGPLN